MVTVLRQWFIFFYGNGGIAQLVWRGPSLNFTDCDVGHPSERCIDFCDTPDAICTMVEQLQFITIMNNFVTMVTTRALCRLIQALMVDGSGFTTMVQIFMAMVELHHLCDVGPR